MKSYHERRTNAKTETGNIPTGHNSKRDGGQIGGAKTDIQPLDKRPSNPSWVCVGSIEYSVGCHPGTEAEACKEVRAPAPEVRYVDLIDQLAAMLERWDACIIEEGEPISYTNRAQRLLAAVADESNHNGHLMAWIWFHGIHKHGDILQIVERERERRAA